MSGMIFVTVVVSIVDICVDYGGVNVFHVCFDLCVVYGVGVCVNVCDVVCVVICCVVVVVRLSVHVHFNLGLSPQDS